MFFEIFFAVLTALVVYSVIAFVIFYSSAFQKFMSKLIWKSVANSSSIEDDEEKF
jgi:hypothetical protein